jgi:hypothetical protein
LKIGLVFILSVTNKKQPNSTVIVFQVGYLTPLTNQHGGGYIESVISFNEIEITVTYV